MCFSTFQNKSSEAVATTTGEQAPTKMAEGCSMSESSPHPPPLRIINLEGGMQTIVGAAPVLQVLDRAL